LQLVAVVVVAGLATSTITKVGSEVAGFD